MSTEAGEAGTPQASLRVGFLLVLILTVWRIGVVLVSPVELYPDEAQYWLWSRELAFGYFSKPPMIAWLIAATTALGGNEEGYVRLAAPLMHAAGALALLLLGRRLYGPAAGLLACALYLLMPGVALSSFVIATDAPLLAFLSLTLLAYASLQGAEGRARLLRAAGFGAALGLAFLSKYAALYALAGVALHLLAEPAARRPWRWDTALLALGAFALVVAPNLLWNATHGFETVAHTAANTGWNTSEHFRLSELSEFLVAQLGVFGPIPLAVLLGGAAVMALRRRLQAPDRLLLAFAAPPLLIVSAQAFVNQANANWAAAAYAPAAVLVAGWLVRWGGRWRWLAWTAVAIQGLAAAGFLVLAARPALADQLGLGATFKYARGWSGMTRMVVESARREHAQRPLSAVATEDRFFFNAAAYYGRDAFGRDLPPLRMWVEGPSPENQAEAVAALTPAEGARVLSVSLRPATTPVMAADFGRTYGREIVSTSIAPGRTRRAELFIGEGFAPRAREGR